MKQRVVFLLVLFIIANTSLVAQFTEPVTPPDNDVSLEQALSSGVDPAKLPATKKYASGKIEVRKFDEKHWREVVGNSNYNDTRKLKTPREQQPEQKSSGSTSGSREANADIDDEDAYDEEDASIYLGWLGPLAKVIFYGAIISIIIVILYQIGRNTSFRSNPKKSDAIFENPDEVQNIAELDTEGLIIKAQQSGNYKLAIRLYFLHLLKNLNENGRIVWKKDKTNREYLSELFSKQYYFDEIRRLTLAYERVWYGEHLPTAETYLELSSEFKAIDQKLDSVRRS